MKKNSLLIAIFVLSGLVKLNAQSEAPKFRFGMKGATQLTWLKPDFKEIPEGFTAQRGRAGFNVSWGPQMEFRLDQRGNFYFSTGFEVNYSSGTVKGNIPKIIEVGGVNITRIHTYESTYSFRYLELPAMIKFRTDEIGYIRYFGLFGMGVGIRLKAKNEFSETTDTNPPITITNYNNKGGDVANPIKGSLLIGLGAEYSLTGNTAVVASLLFNNNFTNILKDIKETEYINAQGQQVNIKDFGILNYLQINLGILF
jgi:hypothetical protein